MMEQQVEPQPSARVGSLLRNCRLRAGLDIAEVAQSLRIRQPFLEAIENGCFETLPAPVYALGFVRSYAEQLGLDAEEIVQRFKSEIANRSPGAPSHFSLPIPAEPGTPRGASALPSRGPNGSTAFPGRETRTRHAFRRWRIGYGTRRSGGDRGILGRAASPASATECAVAQ
jgi:hypothetical protein